MRRQYVVEMDDALLRLFQNSGQLKMISEVRQINETSYEAALAHAKDEVRKGHARKYAVGRDANAGKYIDLETNQGWAAGHFWQEFEDEDGFGGANDSIE